MCNHPELFERKEVKSPFYMKLEPYYIPRLVFREGDLHYIPMPSSKIEYKNNTFVICAVGLIKMENMILLNLVFSFNYDLLFVERFW